MTQARYENLKRVFHGAVDLPPDQRAAFVARECGDDAALRAEVEHLLREHDAADGFLDQPARVTAAPDASPEPAASESLRFASYSVLRTLGRGGMGVVYLAQQDGTQRTVALKIIRAGLATPGALKRFAFEAQVLGRLNHPGIAQIYEAGTADTGQGPQPYFAMELVDGVPITEHARSKDLPLPQRLSLLAQVCDAVEYAHVKGVIHRDLKPGNIFVDATGQVKVLDFGVARATTPAPESGATHQPSQLTEPGQLVGTLPYMSPEQIAGDPDDLDTRSDVYALGVIGYELLADKPAFAVDRLPPLEAARLVKETDPAPLSSFSKVYRGDIETVIAKAMDKDRARRYQSAAALAADIRRYLNDEPVDARPASAWYQVSKFVRRHRLGAASIAFGCIGILVGSVLAVVFAMDKATSTREALAALKREETARVAAEQQERRADKEALIARASTDFMLDLLEGANPDESPDLTLHGLLKAAATRIDTKPLEPDELQAAVLDSLGRVYGALGELDSAESYTRRGLELRRRCLGDDHPDTLSSVQNLATIEQDLGQTEAAAEHYRQAYERLVVLVGEDDDETLRVASNLGSVQIDLQNFAEAEVILRRVLSIREGKGTTKPGPAIATLCNLGEALRRQGKTEESARVLLDARNKCLQSFGVRNARTLTVTANYAMAIEKLGRREEAITELREAIQTAQEIMSPSHWRLQGMRILCARVFGREKRHAEAFEILAPSLDAQTGPADGWAPNTKEAATVMVAICKALDKPELGAKYSAMLVELDGVHGPSGDGH